MGRRKRETSKHLCINDCLKLQFSCWWAALLPNLEPGHPTGIMLPRGLSSVQLLWVLVFAREICSPLPPVLEVASTASFSWNCLFSSCCASPGRALTPDPHHQLQALCACTPLCSPQNWEYWDTSGNSRNVWASSVLTGILPGHFSPVLLSLLQSLRVVSHMLWRRTWQPIPIFLPGESHGQRGLVGDSPQACKESVMIE